MSRLRWKSVIKRYTNSQREMELAKAVEIIALCFRHRCDGIGFEEGSKSVGLPFQLLNSNCLAKCSALFKTVKQLYGINCLRSCLEIG